MRGSRIGTSSYVACSVVLGLLVGCTHVSDIVRQRHATEFHCGREDVVVTDLPGHSYRAVGCGFEAVYVCVAGQGVTCAMDEQARPVADPNAERNIRARAAARRAFECFEGAPPPQLTVDVGADGVVTTVHREPGAAGFWPDACVDAALVGQAVSHPGNAYTSVVRYGEVREAAPPAAPPAPPPAAQGAEPELRATLDAHSAEVLTCAERPMVSVHVVWDRSGAVTISLGGELAGSPQEGCVRNVLGSLHAPAGASGEIVHLVRRPPG